MERRLELRLEELLADAVLDPRVPEGMPHRLEQSVEPFAARLTSSEQRQHAREYVAGRLSEVKRKNSEMIACLHDQDRQAMQKSTGQSPRHHRPLIAELAQQVGGEQGQPDGVLVFDPSAFRKQGKHSVGVARQWCGRMGKIDNCQVRVYLGYVSRIEHALLDVRLYLNKDWAKDKKRRNESAYAYHWKSRNRLAPRRFNQRKQRLRSKWESSSTKLLSVSSSQGDGCSPSRSALPGG
jgi:SRSO17 transposase